MSRREPRWVAVFLKQLERTGNVRLAAEGAGVDFSTAYQRRKRHGEFAERWEASLYAFAQAPLHHPAANSLPACSQHAGSLAPPPPVKLGEDLNVRPNGTLIRGSDARWGKRAEERFLLELTVSANVRIAAQTAGFSTAAVYKRRLKDKHFAAAWEAAVETGKARVQAYLVEAATRTFDPDELPIDDERDVPRVSISEAINIAKMPARDGGAPKGGSWDEDGDGQFVTNEEADAARERIFERLIRIKENIAEQERETGRCHNCGQPLPGEPGQSLYQGPVARFMLLDGG